MVGPNTNSRPPPESEEGPRSWQIRRLHQAAGLLSLSRSDYESLLSGAAGRDVGSSKELDPDQAARALAVMERRLGSAGIGLPWRPVYPPELKRLKERQGRASQAQLRLIWGLWFRWRSGRGRRSKQPSDLLALAGFLKSRFHVSAYKDLDSVTAGKVIEALKAMVRREA